MKINHRSVNQQAITQTINIPIHKPISIKKTKGSLRFFYSKTFWEYKFKKKKERSFFLACDGLNLLNRLNRETLSTSASPTGIGVNKMKSLSI